MCISLLTLLILCLCCPTCCNESVRCLCVIFVSLRHSVTRLYIIHVHSMLSNIEHLKKSICIFTCSIFLNIFVHKYVSCARLFVKWARGLPGVLSSPWGCQAIDGDSKKSHLMTDTRVVSINLLMCCIWLYYLLLGKPRRAWHKGSNCTYHTHDEVFIHIHRLLLTASVYMLVICVSIRAPWVPTGFQVHQVWRWVHNISVCSCCGLHP